MGVGGIQGGGKGSSFMEKFCANPKRHQFAVYRRAIKKFEDHICTVRESIAGGGSWNQEFKCVGHGNAITITSSGRVILLIFLWYYCDITVILLQICGIFLQSGVASLKNGVMVL